MSVGLVTLLILFCLQGIYNGLNTIDQIFFGLELGVFVAVVSHNFVRERLEKHVTKLMEGLYVNRYRQIVSGFFTLFLLHFSLIIIEYISVLTNFRTPMIWIHQIAVNCPVSEQMTDLVFHDAVLVEYGLIFYIAGCYLGLIVDARHFKGTVKSVHDTSFKQTFVRVGLTAIPIGIIYVCPVYLIASRQFVLLILLIKFGMPAFMTGFVLFGYSKLIFERFSVVNLEDPNVGNEKKLSLGQLEEG